MDGLFMVFNAGGDCEVTMPEVNGIKKWERAFETGAEDPFTIFDPGNPVMVYRESVAVFAPKGATEPPKHASRTERRKWYQFSRKSK
jgi:glycogen operon protein